MMTEIYFIFWRQKCVNALLAQIMSPFSRRNYLAAAITTDKTLSALARACWCDEGCCLFLIFLSLRTLSAIARPPWITGGAANNLPPSQLLSNWVCSSENIVCCRDLYTHAPGRRRRASAKIGRFIAEISSRDRVLRWEKEATGVAPSSSNVHFYCIASDSVNCGTHNWR